MVYKFHRLPILLLLLVASCASPQSKLTRDQVLEARKNFTVDVLSFDNSQNFANTSLGADYVRLRVTNNSTVMLPFLTVQTKRFDSSGKLLGWVRNPAIPASNIKPGESVELDYYPVQHSPTATQVSVEVEQVIDEPSMKFFKEFQ